MLMEKIKADMITAKKAGEKNKATLLNTLYAEAGTVGKNKENRESTDQEVLSVIKKFIKGVDETLQALGNEGTAVAIFLEEKKILESYMPQQLTREDLEDIIFGLKTKDMATVMKHLKENYAGLYDGKTASEIVKKLA